MCPILGSWSCYTNNCPRYHVGAALAAGTPLADLVVVRNGKIYCQDCGVAMPAAILGGQTLPPDTPDYRPQYIW